MSESAFMPHLPEKKVFKIRAQGFCFIIDQTQDFLGHSVNIIVCYPSRQSCQFQIVPRKSQHAPITHGEH